ncbi:MAG: hypothetical protein FWD98_08285 [Defluviitaleaceae bacterium]|nr:hypothetical protein [Defluviitaleaceae bacterium]
MILGKRDNVHYVGMTEEMGVHGFTQALSKILESISGGEVVVLADILGGSPLNNTAACLNERGILEKSMIFTGANLPSLIFVISSLDDYTMGELKEQTLLEQANFFSFIRL